MRATVPCTFILSLLLALPSVAQAQGFACQPVAEGDAGCAAPRWRTPLFACSKCDDPTRIPAASCGESVTCPDEGITADCGTCGMPGAGCCGSCCHWRIREAAEFNCQCRGSYKYPVPPQYTYFWPGMYSQRTMTEHISPWRFPPLKRLAGPAGGDRGPFEPESVTDRAPGGSLPAAPRILPTAAISR